VIPLKDENPTHRKPVATLAIIVACIGVYFLWQPTPFSESVEDVEFALAHAAIPCEVVQGRPLSEDEVRATYSEFGRDDACQVGSADSEPYDAGKSVWRSVFASMFLHGSILHLAGNMLFLWIFGNNIEDRLGPLPYIAFYVVSGLAATIAHIAVQPDSTIPVVGASGAIAGVMGAYLVWFPNARVRTLLILGFFVLFPQIRAKWLLAIWFVMQFTDAFNPNSGVAWGAHVGGFVFGIAAGLLLAAVRRRPSPAPRW
jgi:membrane associated rhomboid family serine protease